MKKEETKTTSLRLSDSHRTFAEQRGHGNVTEGIVRIIGIYESMVKQFRPRKKFTEAELGAIAGANKGLAWQYRLKELSEDMACNIEDYPTCESIEAEQWGKINYKDLSDRVRNLTIYEAIAIMDAIDEMFATDKQISEIIVPK